MAWARSRTWKTGDFWSMIEDDGTAHKCGKGKKAEIRAKRWANRLNELRYDARAGLITPGPCLWTIEDLHKAHVADAVKRGVRQALPQWKKGRSHLESQWASLLDFFCLETLIDQIGPERIRAYQDTPPAPRQKWTRPKGPAAINRDLWGVLKPALALARDREAESGFRGDPFAKLKPLSKLERDRRRKPIALKRAEALRFVAVCRGVRRDFGAFVEQLFLTASRVNQRAVTDGRFLRYPAQKRGIPRSFPLRGRLATVSRAPHFFSMKLWNEAAKLFGRPDLNPHDLRHSRLTIEGNRPKATLFTLQKYGGWKDPMIGRVYLHPDAEAIDANLPKRKSKRSGARVARAKGRRRRIAA
jgi:integrase